MISLARQEKNDSLGSLTNFYDNLNRSIASSNAFGQIKRFTYDSENQVTNSIGSSGVATTLLYDAGGRLTSSWATGGGTNSFGYTLYIAAPTSRTNGAGNVIQYSYHPAGWKTNEVFIGVSTNRFSYSPAGDLIALTDGKSQVTKCRAMHFTQAKARGAFARRRIGKACFSVVLQKKLAERDFSPKFGATRDSSSLFTT